MKKKIIIVAAILVVLVVAGIGYSSWRASEEIRFGGTTEVTETGGKYTNEKFGFSVSYTDFWKAPVEGDSKKNVIFTASSTPEVISIMGEPGDTQSFNDFAAGINTDYTIVTIGGQPALRYEFVAPMNEEATAYTRTVIYVIKGLAKGSISITYGKIFATEKEAQAAQLTEIGKFVGAMTFN